MNSNKEIENLLAEQKGTKVPNEVRLALKAQLSAFRQKLENIEGKKKRNVITSVQRMFSKPIFKPAFVFAAIIGLLIIGFNLLRVTTGDAYAVVAERLRNVQSITYVIEIAPLTEVEIGYKAPGLYRYATSWGVEIIEDAVKEERMAFIHFLKCYFTEPDSDIVDEEPNFLDDLMALPEKANEELGEKEINGQGVRGYRVVKEENTFDIWINPNNEQLVHVDINIYEEDAVVHHMAIKNIQINDEIPDSYFDFSVPDGYTHMSDIDENELKKLIQ